MKNYLVFDVGGTDIKYGILSKEGDILEKNSYSSPKNLEDFFEKVVEVIEGNKAKIEGVAMSLPGAVDSESGIIGGASALPFIHGPNFKEIIKEKTGFEVEMENDANCAGLAEVWLGSAKDKKDALFIVIGTGIGGAVIKDSKIHKGIHLHGGEFGYMLSEEIENGKRKYRIWSETASTSSICRAYAKKAQVDIENVNGKYVFQKMEEGDFIAKEVIEKFYKKLAEGIYNLQYSFDPEIVVLGGSISARKELGVEVSKAMKEILDDVQIARVVPNIQNAKFMGDANLIGALFHYLTKKNLL